MKQFAKMGGLVFLLAAFGAAAPAQLPKPDAKVFRKNVRVETIGNLLVVHSDGIPDHTTGDFPNSYNPNTIQKQNYAFKIPLEPKISDRVTPLPMGPIGVAINGIPFYNPYNAEGQDAAKNEVFDECCGHPDPMGRYHYHIYPKCIHTSFSDPAGEHSPLIGYMFDGIAVYGPNGEGGKPPTDLDQCNGHTDSVRGYHYHVTNKFPYIVGGYRGVVEMSNFDGRGMRGAMMDQNGRGRGSRGPGGRRGGPPPFGPPPEE
ncbi:MAG TPA: YHYH protein [Tepidisphaeraceae bacterium]|nr:YHYH protein [Tepidisphaeraceae bacterium]